MKIYLRLNGAKIGKGSYISISSRIIANKLNVGKDCRILDKVKIKGSEVTIGNGVVISSNSLILGKSNLFIGDKSYLGKKSRIDLSSEVYLGKDVGFGENSVIWTHGYFPPADEGFPIVYAPVKIDDCAWVSTNIVILPGVSIGKHVIVGASSLITKNIPDGVVVAGNPARVIKAVEDIKIKKSFIEIMEEIVDKFRINLIIKKIKIHNYILYEFKTFNIFLIEGTDLELDNLDRKKKNIILFKNISENLIYKAKDIYWFDFSSKICKRTNYSIVNNLCAFFREYGIRFLKD